MSRNRDSAKRAGARFEQLVATYLNRHVDDRIERRKTNGAKDRGDIAGLRVWAGERVVVECKDRATPSVGTWLNEAETERGNDDALVGVVAYKRRGNANPGDQLIVMTLRDFAAILTGERPCDDTPTRLKQADQPQTGERRR